ncbi:putative conserved secreted protein [Synechococcus sp. Minos11]|uniref:hypothetical protein n=1 Tax=Synechococcus sp. Minos11 TaxID=221341 RepID=UPI0016467133|nr:hypothetical protein [Synechococcus sp. Minos11]QNJ09995.1 putative conserved secreted protein [Synechococcus sp. Minos11]
MKTTLKPLSSLLAAIALVLAQAPSAKADTQKDIEDLITMVAKTGTKVLKSNKCDEGVMGYYQFSKENNLDQLVLCTNNVNIKDPSAVWEVVSHESAHVMQACNGGPLWKEDYHPRMLRGLKAHAPHYARILKQYRGADKIVELEAFDMELRTPSEVKELFYEYCMKPQDKSQGSTAETLIDQMEAVVGGKEPLKALLGWATKTLPPEQVQMIKDTITSGDFSRIKPMLMSLVKQYNDAMNYSNYRLF